MITGLHFVPFLVVAEPVAQLFSLGHSFVEQPMFLVIVVGHAARQMDALRLTDSTIASSDDWHEHCFAIVPFPTDRTLHAGFFREVFKSSCQWPNTALETIGTTPLVFNVLFQEFVYFFYWHISFLDRADVSAFVPLDGFAIGMCVLPVGSLSHPSERANSRRSSSSILKFCSDSSSRTWPYIQVVFVGRGVGTQFLDSSHYPFGHFASFCVGFLSYAPEFGFVSPHAADKFGVHVHGVERIAVRASHPFAIGFEFRVVHFDFFAAALCTRALRSGVVQHRIHIFFSFTSRLTSASSQSRLAAALFSFRFLVVVCRESGMAHAQR